MKYYIVSLEDEIADKVENSSYYTMGVDENDRCGGRCWYSFADEVQVPEEMAMALMKVLKDSE